MKNKFRVGKEMKNMKKLALLLVGLGALSCTNAKLVDFNTQRLNHIEDYLNENKPNPGSQKYRSLEREAEIDGCNSRQRFFYITLPMIRPILAYTLITSIIGGLQMFDVPQILTNGQGSPDRTSTTLIMFLNNHLKSKNYGMSGALSVYLFVVSAILCWFVYRMTNNEIKTTKHQLKYKGRKAK